VRSSAEKSGASAVSAAAAIVKRREGRRWDRRDAVEILALWRSSGQDIAKFAGAIGVQVQRLRWWMGRVGNEHDGFGAHSAEVDAVAVAFAAVVPSAASPTTAWTAGCAAAVIISAESGARIEIYDAREVSPTWVSALARELLAEGARR
jgi:hypothetical protein